MNAVFVRPLCAALIGLLIAAAPSFATVETIVSLTTNNLAYDPATELLYAASPSNAASNPNSLIPINPSNGALGTAIPVHPNPVRVVSSGDGTYLYVEDNNGQTVQRYDPATATFATPLSILGGLNVSQLVAVPGYSDMVVVSQNDPGFSPPAYQTAVYQNGSALPNHIGNGLGVGGPDIIAVDNTGTQFYGYQTTVTSYTNWYGTITSGSNGGITLQTAPLQGVVTGGTGQIQLAGDQLYDNNGYIYLNSSADPSVLSTFPTTGTFLVDAAQNQFYSIVNSGSYQTVDVFSTNVTNSLTLLSSIPVPGEVGGINEITMLPNGGLALSTPSQIILVGASAVPEPSSLSLIAVGGIGIAVAWAARPKDKAKSAGCGHRPPPCVG